MLSTNAIVFSVVVVFSGFGKHSKALILQAFTMQAAWDETTQRQKVGCSESPYSIFKLVGGQTTLFKLGRCPFGLGLQFHDTEQIV